MSMGDHGIEVSGYHGRSPSMYEALRIAAV